MEGGAVFVVSATFVTSLLVDLLVAHGPKPDDLAADRFLIARAFRRMGPGPSARTPKFLSVIEGDDPPHWVKVATLGEVRGSLTPISIRLRLSTWV
jgi:hypothetical protein